MRTEEKAEGESEETDICCTDNKEGEGGGGTTGNGYPVLAITRQTPYPTSFYRFIVKHPAA